MRMNKQTAIKMFGSVVKLADALEVTRHAIYMWPDKLNQKRADQVMGAAIRTGRANLQVSIK